jgi:hypothetical protein
MALAAAAIGSLVFAVRPVLAQYAPSVRSQAERVELSTICHFYTGPRSGTNIDFAPRGFRPQPAGTACHDGAGSAGIVITRFNAIAPDHHWQQAQQRAAAEGRRSTTGAAACGSGGGCPPGPELPASRFCLSLPPERLAATAVGRQRGAPCG